MKDVALSVFEQQVMDIVWRRKRQCSIREIFEEIQKERDVAYTTVATMVQRLYDKRLLARREDGKGYVYLPKLTKKSYAKRIARSFFAHFFNAYGDIALASFAESIEDLPEEKRAYLLDLLEQHESTK
jgi:predicted transcriptional regulator